MNSSDYLDITDLKETDPQKLHEEICNAVRDTQSAVLLAPLPNVLIMTKAQFDILDPDPDKENPFMLRAYKSKDRIYLTPLNAMDIEVKDAPKVPEFLTLG